ncbi:30S ribosomal protein S3 [Patescibacteria group bacterium]|jgi:small subunit ribosomal protein S3|nr:30S ribosomal protein S3 [Patescibacteria group bacterium]
MGHKVHPTIFRISTTTTWPSRWFAREDAYRAQLRQDLSIREFLMKELKDAAVNRVDIERSRGQITITVHTAKPGLVIGRSGDGIDALKKKLMKRFFPMAAKKVQVNLTVLEVGRPSLEAALVVQGVISELERRMPFRRVLKMAIERVKKGGALGVKIAVSGRLNGAEIARREWLAWGKIPLTNLRADIDYANAAAHTMAGAVGVKVWIYRGDVFAQDRLNQYQPTTPSRREGRFGDRRGPRRDDRAPAPAAAPAPEAPAA